MRVTDLITLDHDAVHRLFLSLEVAEDPSQQRDLVEQIVDERQAKDAGQVTRSSNQPLHGADYFLTGRVESIRRTRGREQTTYLRLSFRLTDAASSAIAWEDDYEMKKYRQAGVYDR